MLAETSRGIALLADIREGFVLLAEIREGFTLSGIVGQYFERVRIFRHWRRRAKNGKFKLNFFMLLLYKFNCENGLFWSIVW